MGSTRVHTRGHACAADRHGARVRLGRIWGGFGVHLLLGEGMSGMPGW